MPMLPCIKRSASAGTGLRGPHKTVFLPIGPMPSVRHALSDGGIGTRASPIGLHGHPRMNGARILLIEDNEMNR